MCALQPYFFEEKKNQVKYLHRECVFLLKKYANWSHSARLSLIHLNEWDERERNREKSSFSRYNQKSLNYRCRNLYFLISIFGDSISGSSVELKWLQVFHVLHIFDGKFAFFSSAQLQFQAKRERNSQIDALQPKTIFDKQENGREKEEEQAVSRRQIVWHFRHVLPLLDYISCKEWTRPKLNFGKYFGWYAFRSRQTLFFFFAFLFRLFRCAKELVWPEEIQIETFNMRLGFYRESMQFSSNIQTQVLLLIHSNVTQKYFVPMFSTALGFIMRVDLNAGGWTNTDTMKKEMVLWVFFFIFVACSVNPIEFSTIHAFHIFALGVLKTDGMRK